MIPKTIHYCWFGRGPKPALAEKCIASWRRFLPDYQIIEWNEDNFDINANAYIREAYAARKFAFVSDYARFVILYKLGGLYFDTDVEVIAPIDDIVAAGPFMGCERPYSECRRPEELSVAAGLGLGAEAGMELYKEIIDYYDRARYEVPANGGLPLSVVQHVTGILCRKGLRLTPEIQTVGGVKIYPSDYFCPVSIVDFGLRITPNTRSIHHYDASWKPKSHRLKRRLQRLLGPQITSAIIRLKDILLKRTPAR